MIVHSFSCSFQERLGSCGIRRSSRISRSERAGRSQVRGTMTQPLSVQPGRFRLEPRVRRRVSRHVIAFRISHLAHSHITSSRLQRTRYFLPLLFLSRSNDREKKSQFPQISMNLYFKFLFLQQIYVNFHASMMRRRCSRRY